MWRTSVCSSALILTLNPLTWKIWWAPCNASRWQMGFNWAFKGLRKELVFLWKVVGLQAFVFLEGVVSRQWQRVWSIDGMIMAMWNGIPRRKTCTIATVFATNLTRTELASSPALRGERQETNRLSHDNGPLNHSKDVAPLNNQSVPHSEHAFPHETLSVNVVSRIIRLYCNKSEARR